MSVHTHGRAQARRPQARQRPRRKAAALLWTAGPTLMLLPAELMEQAFDAIGS